MNFNLTKPCVTCPFRTDNSFQLSNGRVREILQAITTQQATFSCHKTVDYTGDDAEDSHHIRGPHEQHCAGALILLEHIEQPNQLMRISERCGGYDRTKLNMDAPVFKTKVEMITEYRKRNAVNTSYV